MLVQWDESRLRECDRKHTVNAHQVQHVGFWPTDFPVVRSRETITPASGAMMMRVKIEGDVGECGKVFLGVVSAEYDGTGPLHEQVWLTSGNGKNWDQRDSKSRKVNVCGEHEALKNEFRVGDEVEMMFDPAKCVLSVWNETQGWLTSRRLKGQGLGEVHLCVWLCKDSGVTVLGRFGLSQQEQQAKAAAQAQRLAAEARVQAKRVEGLVAAMERVTAQQAASERRLEELAQMQAAMNARITVLEGQRSAGNGWARKRATHAAPTTPAAPAASRAIARMMGPAVATMVVRRGRGLVQLKGVRVTF